VSGACPSLASLEAAAADPAAQAALALHLASCETCRAAVEEIREDNSFLPDARRAYEAMAAARAARSPDLATVPPGPIPGYQILEEIHRGGQGIIYRAIQDQTQRTVAIKMLLGGAGASGRQQERFEREVRIAASLRHPNIVTIFDSGATSDGRYSLAMEFIEGQRLDDWSRSLDRPQGQDGKESRRGALRRRLEVMVKVCDGVLCAHQHAIVHRDLKPANIIVDGAGEPHILDFGIARSTVPDDRTRMTYTGEFAGTIAYASPEQVSGDPSRIDTRTDIYSLGVILYELVSGRAPYPAATSIAGVIRAIESAAPASLSGGSSDDRRVDADVATIILKAMAKDPDRRYQTAAALRDDLARYLAGEAIDARRDSTWYVLRKTVRRHRLVFGAAGAAFVMLAAFGAWSAWQADRLSAALSASNIERGRVTAATGALGEAQELMWTEFLRSGGSADGFSGSEAAIHAYWALWDTYRRLPCITQFSTDVNSGPGFDRSIEFCFADGGRRLSVVTGYGMLHRRSAPEWRAEPAVRIVSLKAGEMLRSAASHDGLRVALFGGGAVRIVDSQVGRVLVEAADPGSASFTGAFSPSGDSLATIGRDGRLRKRAAASLAVVWESAQQSVIEFSPGQFCEPAFSPDGAWIAAPCPDGSLGFWNATTGTLERVLAQPDSALPHLAIGMRPSRIAFSADGGTIAASMGTHFTVWAGETPPKDFNAHGANIVHLQFAPGRMDRLFSVGGDRTAALWDLAESQRVHTWEGARTNGHRAAISPDGRWLVMGGRIVQVFEAAPEPHVSVLHQGEGPGAAIAISPSGRKVAIARGKGGEAGQSVILVDLESCRVEEEFERRGARVLGLRFSPDGAFLYASEDVGRIAQLDIATGLQTRVFALTEPETRTVPLVAEDQMRLSPDGRWLAASDQAGRIGLWETSSGAWSPIVSGGPSTKVFAEFSPDGLMLLTSRVDGIALWDLRTTTVVRRFPGTNQGLVSPTFAPDGRSAALAGWITNASIVDLRSGRESAGGPLPGSLGVRLVFHPSGRIVIGAAQDNSIRIWDAATSRELIALQKHEAPVNDLALTADGRRLITSDLAGTVLVWDLAHYQEHITREREARTSGGSR
jgi:serine/threonine protein kinase/WD40 repeat protein